MKRNLYRALLCVIVLAALVGGGIAIWKSRYTTIESIIRVRRPTHPISGQPLSSREDLAIDLQTNATLLTSRFVVQSAIRDRSISSLTILAGLQDPVTWIVGRIEASPQQESELFRVSMSVPRRDADEYCKLLDAVVKAFIEEVVDRDRFEKVTQLDARRTSYLEIMQSLKTKNSQFLTYRQQHGLSYSRTDANSPGVFIDERHTSMLARRDRLQDRIFDFELQLAAVKVSNSPETVTGALRASQLQAMIELAAEKLANVERELTEQKYRSQQETSANQAALQVEIDFLAQRAKDLFGEIQLLEAAARGPRSVQVVQRAQLPETETSLALD